MVNRVDTNKARSNCHCRVRGKATDIAERPCPNIFRSAKNAYAQTTNDVAGITLVVASTLDKGFTGNDGNKGAAKQVDELVAKHAVERGITEVAFDRGGYVFHDRVKELAEGTREGGLKF